MLFIHPTWTLHFVKKFPVFYRTQRFIMVFTRVHHWTVSWGSLLCSQRCITGPCPEVHCFFTGVHCWAMSWGSLLCSLGEGTSLDHVMRFIAGFTGVHHWTIYREWKQSCPLSYIKFLKIHFSPSIASCSLHELPIFTWNMPKWMRLVQCS